MPSQPSPNPEKSSLKQFLTRTGAFALCLLIFMASGLVLTIHYMSTYKASAILLYQNESTGESPGNTSTLTTILEMIKLPINLQRVKTTLGLELSPDQLTAMVDIPQPREHSNIIRIYAKGNNAALVVDIANTVAKLAVKNSREQHELQKLQDLKRDEAQLIAAHEKLSEQLQEIEEFKQSNPYLQSGRGQSPISLNLQKAREQVNHSTTKYQSKLVEYENLKREIASSENKIQNPLLKESLQVDLIKLQGQAHSTYKVKQDLENRLMELEASLSGITEKQIALSKLKLQASITKNRIRTLSGTIEKSRQELKNPKSSLEVYQLADKGTPLLEGTLLGEIKRFLDVLIK